MQISLTIPNERRALEHAARMLSNMAADFAHETAEPVEVAVKIAEPVEVAEPVLPPPAPAVESVLPEPMEEEGEAPEINAAAGVALDSDGLPWDRRIHSSSGATLQKTKQWKKIRGVDPTLVASVEAELRSALGASQAAPIIPIPPAPPAAPVPPPAAPVGPVTLPVLIKAMTDSKIPQHVVNAALNKFGILSLPLLAVRPDIIPQVYAELFNNVA